MKRMILGVLALLLTTGAVATAQTDEEREEMRRRLRELRQEMRELERQLGDYNLRIAEPLVLSMFGNRGRLGVIVNTARDAEGADVGAVLQAVTPDGPAADAGLEAGDIIITLNGEALTTTRRRQSPGDKLVEVAGELEVGDTVVVEYDRVGRRATATIVARRVPGLAYSYGFPNVEIDTSGVSVYAGELMDRARDIAGRVRVRRYDGDSPWVFSIRTSEWADMELTTLDEDLGAYFGTTEGLLVVRAPEEDFLGLRGGDVILRIGGRVPSSPSHAIRILRSYEAGDEISLRIMRNRAPETLTVTVPERDRDRGMFWEER